MVAGRKRGWGDGQWQRRLPEEGEEDRGAIRKREQGAADRIQKGDGRILGACLTGIQG